MIKKGRDKNCGLGKGGTYKVFGEQVWRPKFNPMTHKLAACWHRLSLLGEIPEWNNFQEERTNYVHGSRCLNQNLFIYMDLDLW